MPGTRHATAAILDHPTDVLIVLGSGLNERDTMHWTLRGRAAAKDHDHSCQHRYGRVDHARRSYPCRGRQLPRIIRSDAGTGGSPRFSAGGRTGTTAGMVSVRSSKDSGSTTSRIAPKSTKPVHPAAVIAALRNVYPRDGTVLIDSGAHRAFAGHYWTAYEPRTYISATNLGPMGWAIPAQSACSARGPTSGLRSSPATAACRCTEWKFKLRRATRFPSFMWY